MRLFFLCRKKTLFCASSARSKKLLGILFGFLTGCHAAWQKSEVISTYNFYYEARQILLRPQLHLFQHNLFQTLNRSGGLGKRKSIYQLDQAPQFGRIS